MNCPADRIDQVSSLGYALGYRISRDGETVAITGDTGTDADLRSLVEDADLALVEATMPRGSSPDPDVLARVHLSVDAAEEIGALAKHCLLIHRGGRRR